MALSDDERQEERTHRNRCRANVIHSGKCFGNRFEKSEQMTVPNHYK